MNWFFVVLLTSGIGDLHDGFLWTDPTFTSEQECRTWVNNNPVLIIQTLNSEFDNWAVEATLCVREDRLEDLNMQPYVEGTMV